MNLKLNNSQIEKFSRQIVLKDIGVPGQKKIIQSIRSILERAKVRSRSPLRHQFCLLLFGFGLALTALLLEQEPFHRIAERLCLGLRRQSRRFRSRSLRLAFLS